MPKVTQEDRDEMRALLASQGDGTHDGLADQERLRTLAHLYIGVLLDDLDAAEKRAEAWEAMARELSAALGGDGKYDVARARAALAQFRAMEVLP